MVINAIDRANLKFHVDLSLAKWNRIAISPGRGNVSRQVLLLKTEIFLSD